MGGKGALLSSGPGARLALNPCAQATEVVCTRTIRLRPGWRPRHGPACRTVPGAASLARGSDPIDHSEDDPSPFDLRVMLPFLLMLSVLVVWLRCAKASFFWAAFFLLLLAPVMNIVPLPVVMACRYVYLPQIGVWTLLACLIERVCTRPDRSEWRRWGISLRCPGLRRAIHGSGPRMGRRVEEQCDALEWRGPPRSDQLDSPGESGPGILGERAEAGGGT